MKLKPGRAFFILLNKLNAPWSRLGASIAEAAVDQVQETFPGFTTHNVFDDNLRGGGSAGVGCNVRCYGYLGMRPVWMVGGERLYSKDIEGGMCDMPLIQRRKKSIIVD